MAHGRIVGRASGARRSTAHRLDRALLTSRPRCLTHDDPDARRLRWRSWRQRYFRFMAACFATVCRLFVIAHAFSCCCRTRSRRCSTSATSPATRRCSRSSRWRRCLRLIGGQFDCRSGRCSASPRSPRRRCCRASAAPLWVALPSASRSARCSVCCNGLLIAKVGVNALDHDARRGHRDHRRAVLVHRRDSASSRASRTRSPTSARASGWVCRSRST